MLSNPKNPQKANLATENERITNGIIDLFYSSIIAGLLACIVYFCSDNIFISIFIFLVIRSLYYSISEYLYQTTLGKLHTGTIVIDSKNKKLSFKQTFIRAWVRIFTGFLSILDDDNTSIHDQISKTYVVKSDKFKIIKTGKLPSAFLIFLIGTIICNILFFILGFLLGNITTWVVAIIVSVITIFFMIETLKE